MYPGCVHAVSILEHFPMIPEPCKSNILVSFKNVAVNHSEQSFTFQRRSWLFLKGLPAIALAQARRAADI
jgi:hypothetical protein